VFKSKKKANIIECANEFQIVGSEKADVSFDFASN